MIIHTYWNVKILSYHNNLVSKNQWNNIKIYNFSNSILKMAQVGQVGNTMLYSRYEWTSNITLFTIMDEFNLNGMIGIIV